MGHFWAVVFTVLTFVPWVSLDQVVLVNTRADPNKWYWERKGGGWTRPSNPARYSSCNVGLTPSHPQPNYWLISDQITVREGNRIDVTVEYRITSCSNFQNISGPYCDDKFGLYVNQSNQFIQDPPQYPDPLNNPAAFEKVAEIIQPTDSRNFITINIVVKERYVLLAFHNSGACTVLYSVKVTYNICPDETLINSLVSLTRTVAPVNDSGSIRVKGKCKQHTVQVGGSMYAYCKGNGEWNISRLQGRCNCKEDMQNVGGNCEDCPDGKYNDQQGLNCTILPSAPRDVHVTFVNQSAVELRWLPPAITGDQTDVYYDVDCRKSCDINQKCLEEFCGSDVSYIPSKDRLKVTQVLIADLSSFAKYTFKIYAKNRVSEVAKRRHHEDAHFIAVIVRTNGSTLTTTVPITEDSKTTMYLNIIYGLAGFISLLIVLIVSFVCYFVLKRRRYPKKAKENEKPNTTEEYEDNTAFSMAAYQNVLDDNCDGFKLDRDHLTVIKVLGTGNFGQVSKAVYGPPLPEVAVKTLKANASQKDVQDMLKELEVMKSLQPHPHVVSLIGCCNDKEPLSIVLEYLPYGDLLGYLRKSRGLEDTYNTGEKRPNSRLSENDLLSFAWMIADGMNYLATMKIVHRDLAARNVLVGENKVCKISDFGLARGLEGDIYTRKTQARLPAKWMPPESLFYGKPSTMSDVWSYGIVMWEVFTIGESPYPGFKSRQVAGLLQKGYRMPRPRHISEGLYSIMTKCWEEQPENRPTFQWLRSSVKRLMQDKKAYVNLDVYDDSEYVNFDMMTEN